MVKTAQLLNCFDRVNVSLKPGVKIMTKIKSLLKNVKGATAIEYGLIAALIAVAGITAFGAVGNGIKNTFNNAARQMG
jgi:pilus assembly protein Flp/PilA